jgi:Zn-finger nucleic acid-binding protein
MKCPVCSSIDLVMADRQGIEIDYCPKCRGVWLDRGELDKIIERSVTLVAAGSGQSPVRSPKSRADDHDLARAYADHDRDEHERHRRDQEEHNRPHGKKRKSFLSDLLEFD